MNIFPPYSNERDKTKMLLLLSRSLFIIIFPVISFNIGGDTKGIFVEFNFRKSKWLLLAAYKPTDVSKSNGFVSITNALDFHGKKYKNMI